MTIKVKLRQKPISGNRQSLYLDFYPAIPNSKTGELTRREFLGLYLFDKAKTPFDKEHNKTNQQIAEQIRQQRDNSLNKPEIYTGFEINYCIFCWNYSFFRSDLLVKINIRINGIFF